MKYTISTKLLFAMTAIAAVSISVSVVVLFAMGIVSSAENDAEKARLFQQNATTAIIEFQSEANALTAYIGHLNTQSLDDMATTAKKLDATLLTLDVDAALFGLEDDVFITIDGLNTWRQTIIPPLISLLQRPETVDLARVYERSGANDVARQGLVAAFNLLEQAAKEIAEIAAAKLSDAVALTRIATWVGLGATLVIWLIAGILVQRTVSRPIIQICEQMNELSKAILASTL